jgi:hypothetical protein
MHSELRQRKANPTKISESAQKQKAQEVLLMNGTLRHF